MSEAIRHASSAAHTRRVLTGGVILVSIGFVLTALTPDQRLVAYPATAAVLIAGAFVFTLSRRDNELPVFEIGTLCVGTTALYTSAPLFAFLLSGMKWSIVSDGRLVTYNPGPAAVGEFFWRHVLYLAALAGTYLAVRGRGHASARTLDGPDAAMRTSVVTLMLGLFFYFWFLNIAFGVSLNQSYESVRKGTGLATSLPYLVRQITYNLSSMQLVLKYATAVLLLQRWKTPIFRVLLVGWLGFEVMSTFTRMGSRSETVLLLLGVALLKHRLVKPWRGSWALVTGSLAIGAILTYGAVRDTGLSISSLFYAFSSTNISVFSTVNEFQVLFGTPFDLFMRKTAGVLPAVPWQVYVSDLLLPIPSQLLPFQKMDPSDWYLGVAGLRGSGFGAMFGVISQAVIGFDWPELLLRGCLLGWVLAMVHRWYVKHQRSYWATLFYLFLCIWSYYSFRASTFYLATFALFQFLPAFLTIHVLRSVLLGVVPVPATRARPVPG